MIPSATTGNVASQQSMMPAATSSMADQASQAATPPSASTNSSAANYGGSASIAGQNSGQQGSVAQQGTGVAQGTAQYQSGGGPPGAAGGAAYSLWTFTPSFSAAVGATVFYLIVSVATSVQLVQYRNWYLQLVPNAAIACAVAAALRVHAALHPSVQIAYIIQQMIFQIVPTLLAVMTVVTFSRVVWWVTPDEKRNRRALGLPPHTLSAVWAGMLFFPDVFKAVAGTLGKPKPHSAPDPAFLLNRVQSVAWIVQFFVIASWTMWALRFMAKSRKWLIAVDAMEMRWRKLGWTCVACGVLLSVSSVCFLEWWILTPTSVAGHVRDFRVRRTV
jgi:hypothetical protein